MSHVPLDSDEKQVPVEIAEDERFPDFCVKLLKEAPDETIHGGDVQTYIPASLLRRMERAEKNYNAVSEEIAEYYYAAAVERHRAKKRMSDVHTLGDGNE